MNRKMELILISTLFAFSSSADLPAGITPCHRSDPDIGNCLKTAMEQSVQVFRNGYPEFNIRQIEPLLIPEIKLIQSKTSENFHLSISFKDLYVRGITDAQFDYFWVDTDEDGSLMLRSHIVFPEMLFDGQYQVVGKLLLFSLDSEDKAHMEFTKLRGNITLILEPQDVNGVQYFNVKDAHFSAAFPESAKMQYDNLVKGNPQLSADMNKILEDMVPALQDVFKPSLDKLMTKLFAGAAFKVFSNVPMDIAMPP